MYTTLKSERSDYITSIWWEYLNNYVNMITLGKILLYILSSVHKRVFSSWSYWYTGYKNAEIETTWQVGSLLLIYYWYMKLKRYLKLRMHFFLMYLILILQRYILFFCIDLVFRLRNFSAISYCIWFDNYLCTSLHQINL